LAWSAGRLEVGVDMAGEGNLSSKALPTASDDAEEGLGSYVAGYVVGEPGARA